MPVYMPICTFIIYILDFYLLRKGQKNTELAKKSDGTFQGNGSTRLRYQHQLGSELYQQPKMIKE